MAFATPEGALLRIGSRAAFAEQELAREYQGVGAGLRAAAAGAARAHVRHQRRGARRRRGGAAGAATCSAYRPGASTAGELAGAVAPALRPAARRQRRRSQPVQREGATALHATSPRAQRRSALSRREVLRVSPVRGCSRALLGRRRGLAASRAQRRLRAPRCRARRSPTKGCRLKRSWPPRARVPLGRGWRGCPRRVGAVAQKATGAALDAATGAGEDGRARQCA